MNRKVKTAIFISGSGSNMVALAKAAQSENFPAQISVVISNRPNADGLKKADALGIPTRSIDHTQFTSRQNFEKGLDAQLTALEIEFVCCAGFMRVLSPWFVRRWQGRCINIHPSLLPKYKGLNTHKRVLESGDKEHGCTIHYISSGVDEGEIIAQAKVPVLSSDTPDILAKRVLKEEHKLYPSVLENILISKMI